MNKNRQYFRFLKILLSAIICFAAEIIGQVEHPSWSYNLSIYEVNIRQYSEEGTFKSFEQHLPRLKEMGAGILWFMPITPIGELNRKGTLGSYYSVKNYMEVNPEFGTMEEFKALVKKIHDMDMYVIVDWVANHTSWDNVIVKEHPEWFNKNDAGEFIPPVEDWSDVIDLNYDNQELQTYMINAMKFWVAETDIDGFRCDVAGMVPMEFWNEVRNELEKIKPVFMLAEAEGPEFHETAFDATYSWTIFNLMNDAAAGKKNAEDFINYFEKEKEIYPSSAFRMRFTSNHDENTWNGTVFERLGESAGMFAVFTCLIEGIPLIYNGQEAGLDKRLKFFEKDPISWKEHPFSQLYTKVLNLKKQNTAIFNGEKGGRQIILDPSNKNIFSFIRENNDDKVIAVFNFSKEKTTFKLEDSRISGKYSELFSAEEKTFSGTGEFSLGSWDYKIYVKK